MSSKKKAVILLSGGLDSATCLALALSKGYECYPLCFDYKQRHNVEIECAKRVAESLHLSPPMIADIDLRKWGGSALTSDLPVPDANEDGGIPITYVPARNLIFLSFAVGYAEAIGSKDIFIGVNSVDYSGYPDCRMEFIRAFCQCANLGTKACDEKWSFQIHTPLQDMSKADIIKLGQSLGLDQSLTNSCYNPSADGLACGRCDSCNLRKKGFAQAQVADPTRYQQ